MIYLKNINIINLFSFEQVSYTFSNTAKLLTGINETDLGQSSNGSGKSSLTESVFLGLFGDSVREQSNLADVVRDGQESGSVELILTNKVSYEEIRIFRTFSSKKSSTCSLYINNIEKKQATVNEYNNFIADYIGIEKHVIKKFFLISRDNYIPFMTLCDNQKKEYITSLIELDIFAEIDKKIKLEEKETEKSRILNQNTQDNLNSQLFKYKKDLDNLNLNYLSHDIEKIEYEILVSENKIKDLELEETPQIELEQQELKNLNNSLINLKDKNKELNIIVNDKTKNLTKIEEEKQASIISFNKDISSLKEELSELEQGINDINSSIKILDNNISFNRQQLDHFIVCPHCDHTFIIEDDKPKEYYNLIISNSSENIFKFESDLSDKNKIKLKLKDEILDKNKIKEESVKRYECLIAEEQKYINQYKKLIDNNELEISQIEKESEKIKNKLELILNFSKIKQEKLDKLNNNLLFLHNNIEKFKKLKLDRLKEAQKDIEILEQKLAEYEKNDLILKNELDNKVKLRLHFIQFKSYLISHFLDSINKLVNYYLSKITDDFSLSIKDISSNKKGISQEKISINVFRSGSNISYTKLSRGEKNRIDLSLILSFRHLYMEKSSMGGINFLTLDEVLSDMDYQGIDSIIRTLNNLLIPSLIVTQLEPSQFISNVITVKKENGISKIYE